MVNRNKPVGHLHNWSSLGMRWATDERTREVELREKPTGTAVRYHCHVYLCACGDFMIDMIEHMDDDRQTAYSNELPASMVEAQGMMTCLNRGLRWQVFNRVTMNSEGNDVSDERSD